MRGHRRGSSTAHRARPLALLAALAVVPLLGACKDIDNSRWGSDPFRTGEAAARASSLNAEVTSRAGTGSGSTVTVTQNGGGTVVVRQSQTVDSNDTSGVVSGGNAGARRSSTATVVVTASPSSCWVLVVDGNTHPGCGNATITDTRGERAGRLTKLSGSTAIGLQLYAGGQVISSGSVSGNSRYVTVSG